MDKDISKELLKIFKKEKINFYLSHKVFEVQNKGQSVLVKAKDYDKKLNLIRLLFSICWKKSVH